MVVTFFSSKEWMSFGMGQLGKSYHSRVQTWIGGDLLPTAEERKDKVGEEQT